MAYKETSPIPVVEGGTGAITLTNHGVLIGAGTGAISGLTAAATGETLMGVTGANPAFTGSPSFSGSVTAATGLTVTSGDVAVTAGNITIPNTNAAGTQGIIKFGGVRFLSNLGTNNTFFGELAGNLTLTVVSAQANTGIGTSTLSSLTTGASNTAAGYFSSNKITIGNLNSTFGQQSGQAITSGIQNSAFGYASLFNVTTGSYNLALGAGAGLTNTLADSSNIYLMNTGAAGESNTIRIGTDGAGNGQQTQTFIAGTVTTARALTVTTGGASVTGNALFQTGTFTVNSGTNAISISGDAAATTVNLATGAGVKILTLGSTTAGSATTLQSSSGGMNINSHDGTLVIDSGTGTIGISNDATTTTLFIGAGAGSKTLVLGSSNTTSQTQVIGGSNGIIMTTATANAPITINSGTGNIGISNDNVNTSLFIGVGGGVKTLTIGSTNSTSVTSIQAGTGGLNIATAAVANTINIGTGAAAKTVTLGSTNSTSSTRLQAGSGGVILDSVAEGALVTSSVGVISTVTGTAGFVLTANAAGTAPSFQAAPASQLIFAYTNVAATPYVVLGTDYYLSVDTSALAITIQLPNAPTTKTVFVIKDRTGAAATRNITLTTVGGVVNIDQSTSVTMNTNNEAIVVVFNGTSYEIW